MMSTYRFIYALFMRSIFSITFSFSCQLIIHSHYNRHVFILGSDFRIKYLKHNLVVHLYIGYEVAQKMKSSTKDFFSKFDQIRMKSLMENFIFCAVEIAQNEDLIIGSRSRSSGWI